MTDHQADHYDTIVVGAGSAGCVLAARLSENRSRKVLLVEAGPHYIEKDDVPPDILYASSNAASRSGHLYNWSFAAQLRPGQRVPIPRGKIAGGSSSLNGTYFIRGRKEDFDEWAALGNREWSYDKVLPYFTKCETDLDFGGSEHGSDGPIPITRPSLSNLLPISTAFRQACLELGFPEEPDKNSSGVDGVGPITRNCFDGIRMSTAITHLQPALSRPNLSVLSNCFARRVIFHDCEVVGLEVQRAGETFVLRSGEVILSAGAIKTPHLLQLSGIGPGELLQDHAIPVVVDNPAVGSNVWDHPRVKVFFKVADQPDQDGLDHNSIELCLNFTAPGSAEAGDLQISCTAAVKGAAPGLQLQCSLHREHSIGTIHLCSADPTDAPAIDLDYLSNPDDLPRLRSVTQQAREILSSKPFRSLGTMHVAPTEPDSMDDASIDAWITENIDTAFHTCGSARMGASIAANSVVDQYCRVHGVHGLRVADLSVTPTIVRRGPSATAVMIGERVAGLIDQ